MDTNEGERQPGRPAPRVTLKRIAEAAGVHPATVSRALDPEKSAMISDETRALVLEKAAELDYHPSIPARTLRHGRSATIGVIVADLENPYTARMVRGIENALEGRGIMALIAETQDDVDRIHTWQPALRRRPGVNTRAESNNPVEAGSSTPLSRSRERGLGVRAGRG